MVHRGAVEVGIGGLGVHRPGALTTLFLAVGTSWPAMAAILAATLGLLAPLPLSLSLLTLCGLSAVLARSSAPTAPSAAFPAGFPGRTVRSTIHISVTLFLCVTWITLR